MIPYSFKMGKGNKPKKLSGRLKAMFIEFMKANPDFANRNYESECHVFVCLFWNVLCCFVWRTEIKLIVLKHDLVCFENEILDSWSCN